MLSECHLTVFMEEASGGFATTIGRTSQIAVKKPRTADSGTQLRVTPHLIRETIVLRRSFVFGTGNAFSVLQKLNRS